MEENMGTRVLELCKENGLTAAELERSIDVGNGSVSRWVKGATPSGAALEKVAKKFRVSTDWLLGLTKYRNADEQLKASGISRSTTIAAHIEDMDLTVDQEKAVIEYIKSIKKLLK